MTEQKWNSDTTVHQSEPDRNYHRMLGTYIPVPMNGSYLMKINSNDNYKQLLSNAEDEYYSTQLRSDGSMEIIKSEPDICKTLKENAVSPEPGKPSIEPTLDLSIFKDKHHDY